MSIAKNIKQLRIQNGLSQDKLAELAQISLRTVQRIESNETEPRGYTLQQIAGALGTTPLLLGAAIQTEPIAADSQGKTFITILTLSALCFIIFPLLGIIIPFIFWMLKRGQIANIDKIAKRLLLAESIWCLLLGLLYTTLFSNVRLPSFHRIGRPEMILITACLLYLANIIFILVNAFKNNPKGPVIV
ncbi:helix-turn-helix domain-containing protein [Mucilaginibacter sp. 14171R-50]|uniref:helix-turn-helix domain-containing protein n=1 Tax=Mucilaginibacter sp. 14171R-50 TaxID=2703789 RepID=UPI00138D0A0C|nr:helix-turn-helix domain-containing protein [Mucilaginibacter sp. 14171R-50]QHS57360.1 helix-turn-helix domain-containing protein [Mucilaginibacter sp. 14171R-50]